VQEAVEALRSDEEVTEAGRARVRRLQRIARRHGLVLASSARPPFPRPAGSCHWTIIDARTNSIVAPTESTGRSAMNLDEVEAWLTREET